MGQGWDEDHFCQQDGDSLLKGTAGDALVKKYSEAFYWAVLVILGNGQIAPGGPKATTNIEFVFSACMLLIGFAIFSVLLGSFSALIASLDHGSMIRQNELDTISSYLRKKKVPGTVRTLVLDYFEYMWDCGQAPQQQGFMEQLPTQLKAKVSLASKKDLLANVEIFEFCPPSALVKIIGALEQSIAFPGQYIIHEGDVADCMFFIAQGNVEVTINIAQGEMQVGVLGKGDLFGEFILITGSQRRSANVKAVTFVNLEGLNHKAVLELTEENHVVRDSLKDYGHARLTRLNRERNLAMRLAKFKTQVGLGFQLKSKGPERHARGRASPSAAASGASGGSASCPQPNRRRVLNFNSKEGTPGASNDPKSEQPQGPWLAALGLAKAHMRSDTKVKPGVLDAMEDLLNLRGREEQGAAKDAAAAAAEQEPSKKTLQGLVKGSIANARPESKWPIKKPGSKDLTFV